MKAITQLIKFLQDIDQNGGDFHNIELSNGVREVEPDDPEYEEGNAGYVQRKPDGTFSIVISGNYKRLGDEKDNI